ncbi:T9SS type A sorting domain-containing protein [Flavobacteriaceae bacterium]|nr:T9SS type A sorting domain-containing protein [Flavobacteriaceae bacterium]
MKKKYTLVAFLGALLSISLYFSLAEDKATLQVEVLRTQHQYFLDNSPFKESQKLSRDERKAQGLPPNSFNERLWDLTLDPALGRPANERLMETQKQLREAYSSNGASQRFINNWEERGPENLGGRTRAILFDPNDINNADAADDYTRVFAGGVSGGLWVNDDITDANSSWSLVPGLAANISVTSIISDPNDLTIMYIGSGESYTSGRTFGQGVWKSTDSGANWAQIVGNDTPALSSNDVHLDGVFYINDIIARSNAGNTELYIAVGSAYYRDSSPAQFHSLYNSGVYKSTDDGASWTLLTINESDGKRSNPNDIELDINNNIWVTTTRSSWGKKGGKILKSTDGTTFTLEHTIANVDRTELEPSQTDSDKFWIVVDGASGADIYTTDDGFASVTQITTEPSDVDNDISSTDYTRNQAFYDLEIEADANGNLIVGGIDLFRSTNDGANWDQISKWSYNNNLRNLNVSLVHADHHGTFFRPGTGNANKIVFTNDGGIYYCDDITQANNSSTAIQERNNGYNTSQFYYGTIDDSELTSNDDIAGGTQDNGTWTKMNGAQGVNTFEYTRDGDGAYTEFDDEGAYMIDSYVFNSHKIRFPPFEQSSNNYYIASNFTSPTNKRGNFINEAVLDKSLDILYCNASSAADGNQIERNSNILAGSAAVIRTQLSNAIFDADVSALKVSPYTTTSTKLYVGLQNGKLLKVSNANTNAPSWSNIMGARFIGSISDIEFGQTEDDLFVTMFNYGVASVWFSGDAGTSWTNIEGDLPDMPVRCILQNPLLPNELIIGTMLGIWRTTDYTNANPTWVQSFNGMRETAIFDLDLKASDNTILATTYGRGFFTSKFKLLGFNKLEDISYTLKVFPTVSEGQFTLTSTQNLGSTQIEIYSITGKRVHETKVDIQQGFRKQFDLSLNSGMYLMKLKGSNFETTKRIIIK